MGTAFSPDRVVRTTPGKAKCSNLHPRHSLQGNNLYLLPFFCKADFRFARPKCPVPPLIRPADCQSFILHMLKKYSPHENKHDTQNFFFFLYILNLQPDPDFTQTHSPKKRKVDVTT